jgi:hypothetical protein
MSDLKVPSDLNSNAQYVQDSASPTEKDSPLSLTDLTTGKVGINTSSPEYPIDIVGRSRVRGAGYNDGGGFWLSDQDDPTTNKSFMGRGCTDENWVGFYTAGGWRFVIPDSTGYIGLGTTSPAGLLQLGNPVTGYSSIVVAPAPTGDTTTDYNNIVNAVKAVYNYISGSDPEEQDKSGTVYLQAGKYCIDKTLKFLDDGTDGIYAWGLKLIGAGMESTIIEMGYTGSGDDDMPIIQVSARGVTIKDLSLETVATQPNKYVGIKLCGSGGQNHTSCRNNVENVRIDYLNKGILLTGNGVTESSAHGNTFMHVYIFRCHTGVQVGESGEHNCANGNHFFGGGAGQCDQYGVRFVNGCSNHLRGFGAENCGDAGDGYAGVSFESYGNRYIGNSMVGCYLEVGGGNHNPSLVKLNSKNNTINNCYFLRDNTSRKFLDITFSPSVFGNVLLGNTFHSTPGGDVFTDEATLFLGDQYQQIRGECDNGLVFQTFWENTYKNAFRWKGKDVNGTLYDLMTLMAYTGSLGIGQTNPTAKAEIDGGVAVTGTGSISASGSTTVVFTNATDYNNVQVGTVLTVTNPSESRFIVYKNGYPNVTVNSSATWSSQGFTYMNPLLKLANNGINRLTARADGSVAVYGSVDVRDELKTSTALITPVVKPASDSTTALQFQTSGGTSVVNVDTTYQRVGIGNTAPGYKLHLKSASSGDGIALERSATSADTVIQFKNEVAVNKAKILFGGTNEEISFWAGTGGNEHVRISSGGNVGIGTTNPGEKLEVSGKIKASNGTNAALNLPILSSNPGTQSNGDLWIIKSGSTYYLRVKTSDGVKQVALS